MTNESKQRRSSRLPGFYKLPLAERAATVAQWAGLNRDDQAVLLGLAGPYAGQIIPLNSGAVAIGRDPALADALGDRAARGLELPARIVAVERRALGIGKADLDRRMDMQFGQPIRMVPASPSQSTCELWGKFRWGMPRGFKFRLVKLP